MGFCLNWWRGGGLHVCWGGVHACVGMDRSFGDTSWSPLSPQRSGWPSHLLRVRTRGKQGRREQPLRQGKEQAGHRGCVRVRPEGSGLFFSRCSGAPSLARAEAHFSAALGSGFAGRRDREEARTQGWGWGGEGEGASQGRQCVIRDWTVSVEDF